MTTLVSNRLRVVAGRVLYALVLWVVISSTLEQFAGLNAHFSFLDESTFHLIVSAIALTAAGFEAVTLLGVSGLRNLWQRPDPLTENCQSRLHLSRGTRQRPRSGAQTRLKALWVCFPNGGPAPLAFA